MDDNKVRQLIVDQLSAPKTKEKLQEYYCYNVRNKDNVAAAFDLPKGLSIREMCECICTIWCDSSQWKLEEKKLLGDEWDTYIYESEVGPEIDEDFCGGCDKDIVNKLCADEKEQVKCWHRIFVPENNLADNFRLEVLTTPDDEQVVGWTVIID